MGLGVIRQLLVSDRESLPQLFDVSWCLADDTDHHLK